MANRRIFSVVVFCAGALTLAWGINLTRTFGEVSEVTGGSPREEAVWFIILGAIGVIAGVIGMFSPVRHS